MTVIIQATTITNRQYTFLAMARSFGILDLIMTNVSPDVSHFIVHETICTGLITEFAII
jgi:hypothetical protein